MARLGHLSAWRHAAVGTAVLGCSALAYTGLIGESREERFDSKQVVVTPAGTDGVRLREVVDQDFARNDRRGYQRFIPNDFGVPIDVTASSPDAPADVDVAVNVDVIGETRIRVGDPDRTVSGQHRYVLEYTLPEARVSTGELALDIIGNDETLTTERFEVVVTGFELADPRCNVGAVGASGGCELVRDADGVYRAEISPLEPGDGITIGGTVAGTGEPVAVAAPPLPERRSDNRAALAGAMVPLGAAGAAGVYLWSRRRGRNEVFAGGAADAAYGRSRLSPGAPLPPPGAPAATPAAAPQPSDTSDVRLVADQDMAALATTEFVPPTGVEPWQGRVLLREEIDNDSVSAWFAGLAARDVLSMERDGDDVTLRPGPRLDRADPADAELVAKLFRAGDTVELGTYNKSFAATWSEVRARQERAIAGSGYWKRQPPTAGGCSGAASGPVLIIAAVWLMVGAGSLGTALLGVIGSPVAALVFGLVVPALAAYAMYRSLLPARSAEGSALALRTESFRRFLAASEGRHVEWAWKQGLLREYSAWAVALGAASAWERALESSSVPPVEYTSGPMLFYTMPGAFRGTYTPPASSGSGGGFSGGGGFSAGSVGGGGGGGRSGSW